MTQTLEHGTYTMYARRKCRCDKCRGYQRARVAKNRADRLKTGNLSHGSRSSYDAGCRCLACKKSRADASKDEKVKKVVHNHVTRDIKPYGMCDACDLCHLGVKS